MFLYLSVHPFQILQVPVYKKSALNIRKINYFIVFINYSIPQILQVPVYRGEGGRVREDNEGSHCGRFTFIYCYFSSLFFATTISVSR